MATEEVATGMWCPACGFFEQDERDGDRCMSCGCDWHIHQVAKIVVEEEADIDRVLTSEIVHNLCMLVENSLPVLVPSIGQINSWSDKDQRLVADYAAAIHLVASDNDEVTIPPVPSVLVPADAVNLDIPTL